ncbi:glucose-1-phosphate thymidylyltransferase [Picrophilus oshimae]|uniref:Glucose-1-phosphate uridylyltransferase n=1 Tax=Picrophilus torridus (strain ATCC 700027 / DSM 9790 / JCM 10055 / NBRC 100828 / KAW 2/3) TaxID=1122961 RepID=Q6L2B0_PICTO|nr:glucose-1-phosphate thymidylyltransferase [Picrophilus oshimae]AAT42892.1 glucose-1-phosphate uridylyltransferase [Picrophilus oshimae DSM 9789]
MKALILHGGSGTRLRPLTYTASKQLIKIAGKPISQYGIEDLRDNGIKDIGIILGDNSPRDVINYYGDGSDLGIKITYIYQGNPRGIADAVLKARDFIANDDFIVYLGDNIVLNGIKGMINFNGDASILLAKVDNPNRFGVALIKDNNIVKLIEKPKEFVSDLALVGVYAFTPEIFKYIEELKPSQRGELEITEAIQALIDNNKIVNFSIINDWWKDSGTPRDLLEANIKLLDKFTPESDNSNDMYGRINMPKTSNIVNSKIYGPSYIGNNVTIKNSYIGPYTSIGDNCIIENSELSNSIIFDNSVIKEAKLIESIIGEDASIGKTYNRPISSKFVVGKGSMISLE